MPFTIRYTVVDIPVFQRDKFVHEFGVSISLVGCYVLRAPLIENLSQTVISLSCRREVPNFKFRKQICT